MKALLFVFMVTTTILVACSTNPAQTVGSTPETQLPSPVLGIGLGLVLIIGSVVYSLYLKRRK
jgi:hypothetical protein